MLYQVVMFRYFAGLSIDETANLLELSATTVKRHWSVGRLWVLERIEKGDRGRCEEKDLGGTDESAPGAAERRN